MKTVCVLDGNMRERKGHIDRIKKSLADYELFIFDKEDTYDYVSQLITEISCFGQRRLYIIKELPRLKKKKKKKDDGKKEAKSSKSQDRTKILNGFKKVLSSIPAGNVVVFDNINISSSLFLKEVKKYGRVDKFAQKLSKSQARNKIKDYFNDKQIKLDEGVASLIADSLNFIGDDVDIDKLELLLIKIHHYVASKTVITDKDVYAVCSSSKEFIVWTLYNILDDMENDNKSSESLRIVMEFLGSVRYFRHEATFLIQSMLWRYGLVMISKNGANNGITKEGLVKEISKICKLESKGKAQRIKMSPKEDKPEYSVKMIGSVIGRGYGKDVLSCYTFDELLSIYHVISKSLVKIRSGCTNSEITILMQIILLTICGQLPDNESIDEILGHKKLLKEAG